MPERKGPTMKRDKMVVYWENELKPFADLLKQKKALSKAWKDSALLFFPPEIKYDFPEYQPGEDQMSKHIKNLASAINLHNDNRSCIKWDRVEGVIDLLSYKQLLLFLWEIKFFHKHYTYMQKEENELLTDNFLNLDYCLQEGREELEDLLREMNVEKRTLGPAKELLVSILHIHREDPAVKDTEEIIALDVLDKIAWRQKLTQDEAELVEKWDKKGKYRKLFPWYAGTGSTNLNENYSQLVETKARLTHENIKKEKIKRIDGITAETVEELKKLIYDYLEEERSRKPFVYEYGE